MKKKILTTGCVVLLAATVFFSGCSPLPGQHAAYSSEELSSTEQTTTQNTAMASRSVQNTEAIPSVHTPAPTSSDVTDDTTAALSTTAATTTAKVAETTVSTTLRATAIPTVNTTVTSTTKASTVPTTRTTVCLPSVSTTKSTVVTTTSESRTTASTTAVTATKATTVKTTAPVLTTTKRTTTAVANDGMAQEVYRLVNVEREKAGLAPLAYYHEAQAAADIRATEIMQSFSHTRPNGQSCFTVLEQEGISYTAAGENIAMGQTSAKQVMEDWMNSQGHRENILNSNFNAIVVASIDNHWVQLFLRV